MRKSLWLLATSAVLLPVVSQAAITFKVEDKTLLPTAIATNDYVDAFVVLTGADATTPPSFDGFFVTAQLREGAGTLSFAAPFAKTTDNTDPPPIVQTSRTQYLKSANPSGGGDASSATFQAFSTGSPEALANGVGLVRIPLTLSANLQPGQTFHIDLVPLAADLSTGSGLVSVNTTTGEFTPVQPALEGGTITVLPEPASLGLLALSGLLGLRRRRTA